MLLNRKQTLATVPFSSVYVPVRRGAFAGYRRRSQNARKIGPCARLLGSRFHDVENLAHAAGISRPHHRQVHALQPLVLQNMAG